MTNKFHCPNSHKLLVKLFAGRGTALENEINKWFIDNADISIIEILQSSRGCEEGISISIFYSLQKA